MKTLRLSLRTWWFRLSLLAALAVLVFSLSVVSEYKDFQHRLVVQQLETRTDELAQDMPILISATAIRDAQGNFPASRTTAFDNTEQKMNEAQLERLARTDVLTSLSNRRDF